MPSLVAPQATVEPATQAGRWGTRAGQHPVYPWQAIRGRWGDALDLGGRRITLMRHGETEFNQLGLVTGSLDVPMTAAGHAQAHALGPRLSRRQDAWFCSTLLRSERTLQIAMAAAGLHLPIFPDDRLNERCLGVLEGRPRRHVPEYERGDLDYAPPGGESYRLVLQRCMSFLLDLADSPYHDVVVSTHVGPMRAMNALLAGLGESRSLTNATFANGQWTAFKPRLAPWPSFL